VAVGSIVGVLLVIVVGVVAWFLLAGRRQQDEAVTDVEFDTEPQASDISFDEPEDTEATDEYLTAYGETDDALLGEFGAAGTFGIGMEEAGRFGGGFHF
jgi:hypothetical protein